MILGLPAICLLIAASLGVPQDEAESAKLDRAWKTWMKFVDRGRLPPSTKNWQRRSAILPATMRLVPETHWSQYTRFHEAQDLVTLVVLRGSYADGQRILHLLCLRRPKRVDAARWFPGLQKHVARELDRADLHVGIQAALLDRLKEGAVAIRDRSEALSHSDPVLACVLLPLLGSFHGNRFRPVLEKYLASGDGSLILAAAEGLSRMGSGGSIEKVLQALPDVSTVARRRALVRILMELDALDDPAVKPDESETQGAEISEETAREAREQRDRRNKEQAAKEMRWLLRLYKEMDDLDDPRLKAPLIPLFRTWRSSTTVPRLIQELEDTIVISKRPRAPTALVFYQNELHETLINLTGTYVRRGDWSLWREFWNREGEDFILAKEPQRGNAKTSASGFFGLPVCGKRVLFILDISGSMSASTGGSGLKAFDEGRTRLARAKQELLSAVNGMSETSSFNVIFFSSDARRWLPGPRPANAKRKKALDTALGSILPGGGTGLLDALKLGMRGKIYPTTGRSKKSVDEIFVLSDGQPMRPTEFILESVAKWNVDRTAIINTVFLGVARLTSSTLDPLPLVAPAAFMKKLAEQNGGKFVAVD